MSLFHPTEEEKKERQDRRQRLAAMGMTAGGVLAFFLALALIVSCKFGLI